MSLKGLASVLEFVVAKSIPLLVLTHIIKARGTAAWLVTLKCLWQYWWNCSGPVRPVRLMHLEGDYRHDRDRQRTRAQKNLQVQRPCLTAEMAHILYQVHCCMLIKRKEVVLCIWYTGNLVKLLSKSSPKNVNSVIIYSPSCCSKPVWIPFFCGIQKVPQWFIVHLVHTVLF